MLRNGSKHLEIMPVNGVVWLLDVWKFQIFTLYLLLQCVVFNMEWHKRQSWKLSKPTIGQLSQYLSRLNIFNRQSFIKW